MPFMISFTVPTGVGAEATVGAAVVLVVAAAC